MNLTLPLAQHYRGWLAPLPWALCVSSPCIVPECWSETITLFNFQRQGHAPSWRTAGPGCIVLNVEDKSLSMLVVNSSVR